MSECVIACKRLSVAFCIGLFRVRLFRAGAEEDPVTPSIFLVYHGPPRWLVLDDLGDSRSYY